MAELATVAAGRAAPWRYSGNPYRDGRWTVSELIREREHLRWLLADLDLNPEHAQAAANGRALLRLDLHDVETELSRRQRLTVSPYAPNDPAGTPPDRSTLVRAVKERLTVADLLERRGVVLLPAGRAQKCQCPLPGHDDRTPSFHVYPDGGWHCFGCGRSGDVIELGRWLLNERSFATVVAALAKEAGLASEGIV